MGLSFELRGRVQASYVGHDDNRPGTSCAICRQRRCRCAHARATTLDALRYRTRRNVLGLIGLRPREASAPEPLAKLSSCLLDSLRVSSDVCRKFARAQVSGARLRRVRDSDDYHTTIFDPGAPRSAKSVSYECQKCGCTLGAPRGGPHKQGGSPFSGQNTSR